MKVAETVLSVLTAKAVSTILADGGTQSWVLNRALAKACKYVVVCRNANHPEVEGNEAHRTAFLVGKIKDIVPSTESPGRWLVLFSEYAKCSVAEQWEGRNPVRYWPIDDFDIDFAALPFQPMPGPSAVPTAASKPTALTLSEAKAGLALTFNIPPSAIEITIRA